MNNRSRVKEERAVPNHLLKHSNATAGDKLDSHARVPLSARSTQNCSERPE
jgi:hypothetical protein